MSEKKVNGGMNVGIIIIGWGGDEAPIIWYKLYRYFYNFVQRY